MAIGGAGSGLPMRNGSAAGGVVGVGGLYGAAPLDPFGDQNPFMAAGQQPPPNNGAACMPATPATIPFDDPFKALNIC